VIQETAPLLGREADLSRLGQIVGQAADGIGSVVLISGEAGIGKTRVCEELLRASATLTPCRLLGRAYPEESTPYAAVADAFRRSKRSEPRVWEAARARAALLAQVVPELGSEAKNGRSVDRPALFETLLESVADAAKNRAALWILDDIQWADDATWEFVKYAARRVSDLSLMLVATYRDEEIRQGHPRWPELVRLKKESSVTGLSLKRLDESNARRLLVSIAPELDDRIVTQIIERGAGTPLLLEELASLAIKPGELPPVPAIMQVTVRDRAARLNPQSRELLDLAAVAGLDVDPALITSLRPGSTLDDLVSVGLLEREESLLRFRHPLLQEAAYEAVTPSQRLALHLEIAGMLAKGGTRTTERVAGHLERARRPDDALSAIEAGAEAANRKGDVGRGASLRLAALKLASRYESLAAHRVRLERAAIQDLFLTERWSELDPLVRDAWSRRDELSAEERAWLANVFGVLLFWTGAVAEGTSLINDELARLEQSGAVDQSTTLLWIGGESAWIQGDYERALRHLERALTVAQRTGDSEAEWRFRNGRLHARYSLDFDREAAIAGFRESAAFARARGLAFGEATGLWEVASFTARLEDIDAAQRAMERAGIADYQRGNLMIRAEVLLLQGRVDEAEAIVVRCAPRMRAGEPLMTPWVAIAESELFVHRGELAEARRVIFGPEASSEPAQLPFWRADRSVALGWLAWEESRWSDAADELARGSERAVNGVHQVLFGGPIFLPLHIDSLLRLGRARDAASAMETASALYHPPARFFEAALAAGRFRLSPTPLRAKEADELAAAAPWPWLRGLLGCWRGELLRDQSAARAARLQFEAIGAHLGSKRAVKVLTGLGSLPESGVHKEPLSRRELEVAELVAEGLSNPAIARRLWVSRPTVASHITHILTKLDFSSRAQIAAWVAGRRHTIS